VHVVANLSRGHSLLDEEKNLSHVLADVQQRRPTRAQLQQRAIGRNQGAIAFPLVDAVDAVHDHFRGLNFDADEVLGRRLVVVKFEVRFVPEKQIVNDIEGANAQHLEHFGLRQDLRRNKDLA